MDKADLRAAEARAEEMIVSAWRRRRNPRQRPLSNYASKAAHPCRFYLYALRVYWDKLPEPDDATLGIFRHGDEMEDGVFSDMKEGGFNVEAQQILFEDRKHQIRGRIDGYSYVVGDPVIGEEIPTEIKGLHPSYADQVTDFRSMLTADKPWLRLYPGQTLLYAVMPSGRPHTRTGPKPHPLVMFIVRNKSSRKTKFRLEEVADFKDLIEDIHGTLRSVNWHVVREKEPKPMAYDPVMCDRCDAAHLCPTMKKVTSRAKVVQLSAPAMDDMVLEMIRAKPDQLLFNRLEKQLKTKLEDHGWFEGKPGDVRTIITDQVRLECKVTSRKVREGDDLRPQVTTTGKKMEYSAIRGDSE